MCWQPLTRFKLLTAFAQCAADDDEAADSSGPREKQQWQQHVLADITQQIKGISAVPPDQQGKQLASLAQQARDAAKGCKPQVADQLLKLADFAVARGSEKRHPGLHRD